MLAFPSSKDSIRWQVKRFATTCSLLSLLFFSAFAYSAGDRIDYDLDDDGLIEINDLDDLDEIRNNLDGKTLYGSNAGCPDAEDGTENGGCNGFELTSNLNFDTNQDGLMDANDDYWNGGSGWIPIDSDSSGNSFVATFDGNGHVIRNLYIDLSSRARSSVGLFAYTQNAVIGNLGLTGPLMAVKGGYSNTGSLVGWAELTDIHNVFNTGPIQGRVLNVGGLVGYLKSSRLLNALNTGSVTGDLYAGGLVGRAGSEFSRIQNGLNTGLVSGNEYVGGLVGLASTQYTVIENSYWASNASGQSSSALQSEANSYVGLPLATLQCAIQANTDASNSSCVSADGSAEGLEGPATLFKGWEEAQFNEDGLWNFGSAAQAPAMVFTGGAYRDSDSDGVLDSEDHFPLNNAASMDADADGHPDAWLVRCDAACILGSGLQLDQFPQDASVWQDEDLDGLPESWSTSCDDACQNVSNWVLDVHPNDSDNDGIGNLADNDDNNDGIKDIDANSDGLVEVHNLTELNAMRHQLDGAGLRTSSNGQLEQSGCPLVVHQGVLVRRCHGYELTTDLDFDTNQDGLMDANDDYWNGGSGWAPIGSGNGFAGTFDGNGHVIRNLYIRYSGNARTGFFAFTENAVIRNLGLTGPLMAVHGSSYIGSLVGVAYLTDIQNVFSVGPIHGSSKYIGGLVGSLYSSSLQNVLNTGPVTGSEYVGGLVGVVNSVSSRFSRIQNGLNTGLVTARFYAGGLVASARTSSGGGNQYTVIENSYWASDASGRSYSSLQSEGNSYVGLPLSALQCATQANTNASNSGCVSADGSAEGLEGPVTLFKGWEEAQFNEGGLWNFGSNSQSVVMEFNGNVYRDSDSDRVVDFEDDFPFNRAASIDADADGHPDMWSLSCDPACIASSGLQLDQFPEDASVWQDEDLDGLPESWATGCDDACQNASDWVLDAHPNDSDNDGIDNLTDNDDNNDGVVDIDANSDGLVELHNLTELNAMRYQLDGAGLRATSNGQLQQSGCPLVFHQGVLVNRCHGYELTTDLDFDTNQDGTMDANDDYWNDGSGWSPIGYGYGYDDRFVAIFDGNGHVIRNLYISQPSRVRVGLFAGTENAVIRNLGLTGPLMSVHGFGYAGSLVGSAYFTEIHNVFNAGPVHGSDNYIGGLVGYLSSSCLQNALNTGSVSGGRYVGGLVGRAASVSCIRNGLNTGLVTANYYAGGLVGDSYSYTDIENSYWASDASGQSRSDLQSEENGYVGLPLAILQCATQANTNASNSSCVSADGSAEGLEGPVTLFKGWEEAQFNEDGLWNFGGNNQSVAMEFNGNVYRDSDGDFIFDAQDTYPLISLGGRLDTDGDGIPNDCDESCDSLGMLADTDDDNDGVADIDDRFPLDSSEQSDFDNDGIGDVADLDDDNDGVDDVNDPNLGADNGAPEITYVPSIRPVAVTTEKGEAFELLVDDNFLSYITTIDAIDTEFTYEASLDGSVLPIDENDIMLIPAGRQAIQVVAIDTSGNRSEPVEMVSIVYPKVRFDQITSVIGENTVSEIKVRLTGDAPEYPVVVDFIINESSDIQQADLSNEFDISAVHQIKIPEGDEESLNREGFISIPIIEDNESENDELMVIDLTSAYLEREIDEEVNSLFAIDEANGQHELTVTYQNLPPSVSLKLEQNGIEVTSVLPNAGEVTITAVVQDGNGSDEHQLIWDLNSLGLNTPLGNTLTFNPSNLPASTYEIHVLVTDSGVGQLTDEATISFDIEALEGGEIDGRNVDDNAQPESGGGALQLWLMLSLLGLLVGARWRYRS